MFPEWTSRLYLPLAALAALLLAAPTTRAETLDDEAIHRAIHGEILMDGSVDVANVDIEVAHGIATLTGEVDSVLARERAARLASVVRGVRAVSNRLEVALHPEISDEDLRVRVIDALLHDPAADGLEVAVEVDAGRVTLTGTVQSWAERQVCERVASGVEGVTWVENELLFDIATDRSDPEIRADVEARLRHDALVRGGGIEVAVEDGVVTLTGLTGSVAEKQRAAMDARVAGVRSVDATGLEVDPMVALDHLRDPDHAAVSDERIEDAIRLTAALDPRVLSFEVEPSSEGGVVTLTGVVDTLKASASAAEIARNTAGVISVRNRIRVRPLEPRTDVEVQVAIEAALDRSAMTSDLDLEVQVQDGHATLRGEAASYVAKAEAGDLALTTPGVTSLDNEVEVAGPLDSYTPAPYLGLYGPTLLRGESYVSTHRRSDAELARRIRSQLWWSPFVDSDQVVVSVEDGKAVLEGEVDSWSERRAATENAFEGGAYEVVNRLDVAS